METNILVTIKRSLTLRAIVESLRSNLRVKISERRVESLKESCCRVHENALVRSSSKDLRRFVFILRNAQDAILRV
jgi:hypothetical protein